ATHVELAAYRTNYSRTIQIYGKYDAVHQSATRPLGVSALVSVEGTNNFRQDYAPTLGASISRDVGTFVALYAVPMWFHNSAGCPAACTSDSTSRESSSNKEPR